MLPDQVVLHVGTNDLKQKEPRHVADSIVGLARQIENSCEATVAVSELISRRDELNEAVKTTNCKRVTGNHKVENWKQSKNRWSHLKECDFAEPPQDGLVDLLIGVDNAELHYSRADVRGEEGDLVARLGPLGWACVVSPDGKQRTGARAHIGRTLFTREPNFSVSDVCCDVIVP